MRRYDISEFLLADSFYRVTLFEFQYWNNETYSYRKTPRPDHGFLLVTRGKIDFSSEETHLVALPGDMIFLPKGSYYEAIVHPEYGETKDYLINFETDPLPLAAPSTPALLFHAEHRGYLELFERAMEKRIKDQIGEFGMKGVFFNLLEELSKDGKNRSISQTDRQLKKAAEMLAENGEQSIAEIAHSLGISESGFRSLFKKAYGVSPGQYRMNIRINQAKYFLESTAMSVNDIAEKLGFYDEAYFCKIFRKYAGVSPKKYSQNKKI